MSERERKLLWASVVVLFLLWVWLEEDLGWRVLDLEAQHTEQPDGE